MKVWIGAIALVGVLLSGGAEATMVTDGNNLLQSCQSATRLMDKDKINPSAVESMNIGQCFGIIEGVKNTLTILYDKVTDDYKVCFPKGGITTGQGVRIVEKYLRDNPEKLNMDETFLTMLAFHVAYPCNN